MTAQTTRPDLPFANGVQDLPPRAKKYIPPSLWAAWLFIPLLLFLLLCIPVDFSRSDTILPKLVLPGNNALGPGSVSMKSLSPSILKWRLCSVPFQVSFQETSTVVMKSPPQILM